MVAWSKKYSILDILCVLLLLVFACTLVMTFFYSIALDELAWFVVSGRALYNGFKFQHFYYECKSNLTWDIPWVFLPGRVLVSLLHPETYAGFRVMGISLYMLLIAVGSVIIKTLFAHLKWLHIIALITALLSLGVLPYNMVSVRPESSVALGILLLFAIFCNSRKVQKQYKQIFLVIIFLFICSWFFSIHPKTVLFLPAIAWMAFLLSEHRKKIGFCCLILVMTMGLQSYQTWQNYIHCPDNKKIEGIHNNHAVSAGGLVSYSSEAMKIITNNIMKSHLYISAHLFKAEYFVSSANGRPMPRMGEYLPDQSFPRGSSVVFNWLIYSVIALIAIIGASALVITSHAAVVRKKCPSSEWRVGMTLLASIFALICFKSGVVEYETVVVWPILVIISLIVIFYTFSPFKENDIWAVLLYLVIVISVASQLYTIRNLWPYFQSQMSYKSDRFPSYSIIRVPVMQENYDIEILEFIENRCGLGGASDKYTFIDRYAYTAFYRLNNLMLLRKKNYLGKNLVRFISRNYSPFRVIGHCNALPRFVSKYGVRKGDICCITSDMLP